MKLALGTAQFGLDYGVANKSGQVPLDQAGRMIHDAWHLGFDTLDTAITYGDSESRLGQIGITDWRVITKLSSLPDMVDDIATWVEAEVTKSMTRLGVARLQGLLLHRPLELLSPSGADLYRAMVVLRERGLVSQIGISVYGPEELDALFSAFRFDLVQAPLSIVDRRLADSGWLQRMVCDGIEVHVRSVFLQGLLLMESSARLPAFRRWQPLWQAWDVWLAESGLSPLAACLRYVESQLEVSRIVVGAGSSAQLKEIVAACAGPLPSLPNNLQCDDPNLLVPSNWTHLV